MERFPILTHSECVRHLREHSETSVAGVWNVGRFYKLAYDLHAYKMIRNGRTPAIANLIIPKGAHVYARNDQNRAYMSDRKMRANKAYVHSIVECPDDNDLLSGRPPAKEDGLRYHEIVVRQRITEAVHLSNDRLRGHRNEVSGTWFTYNEGHDAPPVDGAVTSGFSAREPNFAYEAGMYVKARPTHGCSFNDDRQCTTGIHFFINLVDALAWR